jgi:hypothetical protein
VRRYVLLVAIAGLALLTVACEGGEDRQLPVWPDEYTMRAGAGVEIQFVSADLHGDYTFSALIRHFPSESSVGINRTGSVTTSDLNGPDGTTAVCAVLTDESLMAEVMSRVAEIDAYTFMAVAMDDPPCGLLNPLETWRADNLVPTATPQSQAGPPGPAATAVPGSNSGAPPPPYPEDYVLIASEDVEIRFAYPSGSIDWPSLIFVHHFASSSRVLLDREGRVTTATINGDEAQAAICAVLTDAVLVKEVVDRAAGIEDEGVLFRREPLATHPCEGVE